MSNKTLPGLSVWTGVEGEVKGQAPAKWKVKLYCNKIQKKKIKYNNINFNNYILHTCNTIPYHTIHIRPTVIIF